MRFSLPLLLPILLCAVPFCFADDDHSVELERLGPHVWVHTSHATVGGYRVDSHGLVIDAGEGLVLADTCWNDAQTQTLLDRIKREVKKPVVLAVITHAHDDRIGGIRTLLKHGIKTVSTPLTAQQAAAAGYPRPAAELDPVFTRFTQFKTTVEVFYPGSGHTVDNLTMFIPADGILFGACLIKALSAKTPGNTADAVMDRWADSVRVLQKKYPNAKIVVPGHGPWGGRALLDHTLKLVGKH